MDKKPIGYIPGKQSPLDKKIKANPKYENVKKKLSTGLTVRNIKVLSNQLLAKRKGEHFHRIKHSQLETLLTEETQQESIYNLNQIDEDQDDIKSVNTQNSKLTQNTKVINANQNVIDLTQETEFILVDTREQEEYEDYHIVQSINQPQSLTNRDKIRPEVNQFKNKDGKLIVIYNFDEKPGVKAANQFFEKGFDNIYLLTAGIEEFMSHCQDLIDGNKIPQIKPISAKQTIIEKRSNYKEPVHQIINSRPMKDNMSELSRQFDNQSISSKRTINTKK